MSKVAVTKSKLDTLASSISVKSGESLPLTLDEMKTAVDGIQTGGTAAISVVDTTDSAGGTIRTITALDISDTTAVASDVAQGKYFYTADGTKTAGTASGGGGSTYTRTTIASSQSLSPTSNGTYYSASITGMSSLSGGSHYIITYNGTEYMFTCQFLWGSDYLLGDINYFYGSTGMPYPFGIIWTSGTTATLATGSSTSVTLKIERLELS